MKVIAINGSPKKEGNTAQSLQLIGDELAAGGIEFEILQVGHKMIHTAASPAENVLSTRIRSVPSSRMMSTNGSHK